MQIKNNLLVVTTRVILHHPPARDPRKKRLRREGYVRDRASLPGAPESRRVALVEDDEPGPGEEVQDVFPPGVGKGHSPLDGPRVEITDNDNMPNGAEHALLQTINLVAEVLDGLVWGELATEESYIPTPYPDESSATSVTPYHDFLWVPGPESSSTETVWDPNSWVPVPILFADQERVGTEIFEDWPGRYGLLASAFCLFECGSKNTALTRTRTCLLSEETGETRGAVFLLVALVSAPDAVETSVRPSAGTGRMTERWAPEASLHDHPSFEPATHPSDSQVLEAKQLISVLFAQISNCHTLLAPIWFCQPDLENSRFSRGLLNRFRDLGLLLPFAGVFFEAAPARFSCLLSFFDRRLSQFPKGECGAGPCELRDVDGSDAGIRAAAGAGTPTRAGTKAAAGTSSVCVEAEKKTGFGAGSNSLSSGLPDEEPLCRFARFLAWPDELELEANQTRFMTSRSCFTSFNLIFRHSSISPRKSSSFGISSLSPLPQFPGARTSVCPAPIHTRCRTCWGSPVAMQSPISASMPHFLAKDRSSWLLITYWRGPSAVRGTNQSLQQDRNTPRTPQHAPVERRWKDTRNAGSKRRRRAKLAQKRIKTVS
ncbi:hypothetical protein J6590_039823 [Homalodisca vitripennis]|nr:hypothetical protein J6590_039823 [Homalodisca vitripennis]